MGEMKWRILKDAEYRGKVEKVVIKHEGNYPVVYLDEKGIPTAGPGKALVVRGIDGKTGEKKWVIAEGRPVEGVNILESTTGKSLTAEQRQVLQTAADNLNKYGNGKENGIDNKVYRSNAPMFYKDGSDASLKIRTDPDNNKFGVVMTEPQVVEFKDKVIDASEKEFDDSTTKFGDVRLDKPIPASEERAALISIYHQSRGDINSDMRKAINNGDRAAVIRSIEGSDIAGTYKTRRKAEADQFGRPDAPDVVRHENDSQAGLDATFKTPPKVTPSEPFGPPKVEEKEKPQEIVQEPVGAPRDELVAEPKPPQQASIMDYFKKAAEQVEETFVPFWLR